MAFQAVRAQDYPGVLISQVLDGELSVPGSVYPALMTPDERTDLADKLKASVGPSSITDLAIDVATNPFVLMFFAFGFGRHAKIGSALDPHPKFSASLSDGRFALFRGMTANASQTFRGNHLEGTFLQLAHNMDHMAAGVDSIILPVETKAAAALGFKSRSDWLKAMDNGDPTALKMQATISAVMRGWGQKRQNVKGILKEGEDGVKRVATSLGKEREAYIDKQAALRFLRDEHDGVGLQLLDAYEELRDRMFYMMYAKAPPGIRNDADLISHVMFKDSMPIGGVRKIIENPEMLDAGKIAGMYRAIVKNPSFRSHLSNDMGAGMLRQLLGPNSQLLEDLQLGKLTQGEFNQLLKASLTSGVKREMYMPRNIYQTLDQTGAGRLMVSQDRQAVEKIFASLNPSVSTVPREMETSFLPSDIGLLDDFLTEAGREQASKWQAAFDGVMSGKAGDKTVRFLRLNATQSWRKYAANNTRSWNLFVAEPNQFVANEVYKWTQRLEKARAGGTVSSFNMQELLESDFLSKQARKQLDELGRAPTPAEVRAAMLENPGTPGVDRPGFFVFDDALGRKDEGASILELVKKADTGEVVFSENAPMGGWRMSDMLWAGKSLLKADWRKQQFENLYLPAIMGQLRYEHTPLVNANITMRKMIGEAADGKIGDALAKSGTWGQKLQKQMKLLSEPQNWPGGRSTDAAVASYLYGTHLGLNLGSVSVNMLQPWITTGPLIGFDAVAGAYAKASLEIAKYGQEAAAMVLKNGRLLTDAERAQLLKKHVPFAEFAGISPRAGQVIEDLALLEAGAQQAGLQTTGFLQKATDVTLTPFQMAEWLNRNVTAHAVANQMKKKFAAKGERFVKSMLNNERTMFQLQKEFGNKTAAEIITARDETFNNIFRVVNETQFASSVVNTPAMFLNPQGSIGFLSNPLARQFLTFSTRMLTTTFQVFPTTGPYSYGMANWALGASRMAGVSALIYEAGKHALRSDLSRGLFPQVIGDIYRDYGAGAPIPLPPVLSIPADMIKNMAEGDFESMKFVWPRMVPGGVAVSRALGAFDQMPGPLGATQRMYVGWDEKTPDGFVPIYKPDGSLIRYAKPMDIYLKAFGGLQSKGITNESELTKFLTKNAEQMREARRQYLIALNKNDLREARSIAAEYEKRFGMPLGVNKNQLRSFLQLRTQPRSERVLNRMPQEVRKNYARLVIDELGVGGLGSTNPADFGTAKSRAARIAAAARELPPEVKAELTRRQKIAEQNVQAAQREVPQEPQSFTNFQGFNR